MDDIWKEKALSLQNTAPRHDYYLSNISSIRNGFVSFHRRSELPFFTAIRTRKLTYAFHTCTDISSANMYTYACICGVCLHNAINTKVYISLNKSIRIHISRGEEISNRNKGFVFHFRNEKLSVYFNYFGLFFPYWLL